MILLQHPAFDEAWKASLGVSFYPYWSLTVSKKHVQIIFQNEIP
jgi:hypothetical protein